MSTDSAQRAVTTLRNDSGVATIRIDNPPANTLTMAVLGELRDAIAELESDAAVRCVVIEAAGRTFVAGGDVGELLETVGDPAAIDEHVGLTGDLFTRLGALPVPVIAAVDGAAVGGGLELVLRCDLTVATASARFGLPEAKLGLIPGAGGTQLLARRCGVGFAARMLFTASLVEAPEALSGGLITEVVEGSASERAHALAERIASLPASAVRAAKTALYGGLGASLSEGLALERAQFTALMMNEQTVEGLRAFLAR